MAEVQAEKMGEPPSLEQLCADLAAEHEWLLDAVANLDREALSLMTPAEGWTVRDQLTHLAFFDDRAVQAAVDPEGFAEEVERARKDFGAYEAAHLEYGRSMGDAALIGWFNGARNRLVDLFSRMDPKERLPWYGPSMSARSSATARYMETWAHGLDVADALGVQMPLTDRVRHVCELGVRTRGWSFAVRGLDEPEGEVYVELTAPSGARWQWGALDAPGGSVIGRAEAFAAVVTQRRALEASGLEVAGPVASAWMEIAQCFAGPPGTGRGRRS
jgi:uncharacterized protein (TIGR03084 family)